MIAQLILHRKVEVLKALDLSGVGWNDEIALA
jgi:hypothetical protein